MKACLGNDGCNGTGKIFGGLNPLRFACCIRCSGTGFVSGGPIGPAVIKMHSLGNTTGTAKHIFTLTNFSNNALMAHVMAKAGIFPSISQARKNGWDKPIEVGEWTVTKKRIKVEVKNV
jgi:hypothetical protein